ncbi:MAG: HD domain-containing protein [Caldilineae bacterium]|nr:MAG: HD domain-containing protein [Caldilineae bacterium]
MPDITPEFAQTLYTEGDAAHAFDHVLRVTRLAEHIARREGADIRVVRAAGLLHDCVRHEHDHHLAAARRARQILADEDPAFVEAVAHSIAAHRFSRPPAPRTLEAQCLADADKLDAIGAIGIARAFAFAGHHGNRLWAATLEEIENTVGEDKQGYRERWGGTRNYTPGHEFVCKLAVLTEGLYTATAREIAARRHAFMVEFFRRLDAEALGLA